MADDLHVLVAGGGVAALEAVLALGELAGDRASVALVAPDRHFTHRALAVSEPFRPRRLQRVALEAIAADRGIALLRDAIARVDPDERAVFTHEGTRLPYDRLVVALGARPVEAVPGALTFRGTQDAGRVKVVADALRDGRAGHAAFVVPFGTTWALPAYELALQAATAAPGADLHLVTPEDAPLCAFGLEAGEAVADLLARRGVTLHLGAHAEAHAEGRLWLAGGASIAATHAVALPGLAGPRLRGLPADADGFVPVDEWTRVRGEDAVHAIGDMADHALKQGGLAAQQADVAAAVIAADAGADVTPRPYRPVLRGLLLAGGETRFLRFEPGGASEISRELLWWPPHKVVGHHLAPYLASHLRVDAAPA